MVIKGGYGWRSSSVVSFKEASEVDGRWNSDQVEVWWRWSETIRRDRRVVGDMNS